jgi:SAM-dependent methyltransferase
MDTEVARLFDAMADSYERLEPWYEHLYGVLHGIVRRELAPPPATPPGRALDAGCGTGFQTTLLEGLGWETHGIDISAGLLAVARRRLARSVLVRASVERLPYPDARFDVAVCCGSTLSLVTDPACALRELGRVLRPCGRLLLECEHRWSLDLAWAALSSVTLDSLGYGMSPRAAWRQVVPPRGETVVVRYPCVVSDGATAYMNLRLFTMGELDGMLRAAGFIRRRCWGIHTATNLIPSTVLHRDRLPGPLGALYRLLRAVDARLSGSRAGVALANSLVVLATKVTG